LGYYISQNLLPSLNEIKEAEIYYKIALLIDPKYVDALYYLGILLKKEKENTKKTTITDIEEMISAFEKVTAIEKDHVSAISQIAILNKEAKAQA
jgi:tetratricopeptide (TPR) repeat protein